MIAVVQRRFWWILIAIVAVAFAVRWGYILEFRRDQASCNLIGPEQICGDAYSYHTGANLLADGRGYIDPLLLREDIVRPGAIHPPAYVTYLGLWSMLGARSVLWHQFASVVLGLGTVVVTALFGRDLISERVGLLAASAMAVYPYVWLSDGAVMSESMALLGVACAAWAAARFLRTPSPRAAGLVGGAAAFAMLSRSEFALYLPLVLVVGLLGPLRSLPRRARLGQIAAAGVVFASLSAPWVVRNLTAFHHPVVITTGLGLASAYANCDTTYEEPNLGYWSYWCAQTITVGRPGLDESDEERLFRRQALDYIDAHRSELPKVLAARFLRQWNLYAPNNQVGLDVLIEGRERTLSRAALMAYYAMIPFAVVGSLVLRRGRNRALAPLLIVPIVVSAAALVTYANTRFRAPAELTLVVLAAVGALHVFDRLRAMRPLPR